MPTFALFVDRFRRLRAPPGRPGEALGVPASGGDLTIELESLPLGDAFRQRPQHRLVVLASARACSGGRGGDRRCEDRTLGVCSGERRDRAVLDHCVELMAHHHDAGGLLFSQFDRLGVPIGAREVCAVDFAGPAVGQTQPQSRHTAAVKGAASAISSNSTWRCWSIASARSSPEATVRSAPIESSSVVRAACSRAARRPRSSA
jgi:hypothetical protein